ncbi:MAG TPA: hypothetical protein VFS40_01440 [Gemmatimonadales bacterium]|nr:hypothetical protein [Gemmatimonadales bacterium]
MTARMMPPLDAIGPRVERALELTLPERALFRGFLRETTRCAPSLVTQRASRLAAELQALLEQLDTTFPTAEAGRIWLRQSRPVALGERQPLRMALTGHAWHVTRELLALQRRRGP